MFDLPVAVRKKGTPYYIVWTSAFDPKKFTKLVSKEELAKFDIKRFCEVFEESLPTPARAAKELSNRFSLYLTGHLLLGLTRVFTYRVSAVLESAERIIERINQPWDTLSIEDEASLSSVAQHQQRPMSPMDDFDPHPDFADHPPTEEEPRGDNEQHRDENEQPAAGEQLGDDELAPERQPRRRAARKRGRIDTDDEDEDHDKRRKPRRKPARKGVVTNLARREDITLREDLVDSLERDLLENDLEPLNEDLLNMADNHPIQLNDDTFLILNPRAPENPARTADEPVVEHDFDYPEYEVPAPSSPVYSAQQQTNGQESGAFAVNITPPPNQFNVVHQSRSEQFVISNIDLPPIQSLTIGTTPEQARRGRTRSSLSSVFRDQQISDAILTSPFIQDRMRSASPSRIIAINLINSPEPSAPPSHASSPPVHAIYNFDASRSVTPVRHTQSQQRPDADHDFDFAEREPDETVNDTSKQVRRKRAPRTHAREPPVTIEAVDIANRDDVYLQRDHRNRKYGKFRARLDGYQNVYKHFLGEDVVVEADDDLRDFLDERIGRLDVERARRRRDNTAARQLSPEGQPGISNLVEEEERPDQQMADQFEHDFDNDFRPLSPLPGGEQETPMQQDQLSPLRKRTSPFVRPRTPIQQFNDIEYVEPVPLPEGMEHLLSPPRALPRELFNTSAQAPFKELGCKYDHIDLYWHILHRAAKEDKVVFKFSDFANRWPRPYIAKQYHNFLLLIQLRKIIGRTVNNVFYNFLIIPNDEFKQNMAKIFASTKRDAAGAV